MTLPAILPPLGATFVPGGLLHQQGLQDIGPFPVHASAPDGEDELFDEDEDASRHLGLSFDID